jgi:DNA-binding MarR family transcriptional regulator
MRDLLRVIAEPTLAKRDQVLRAALLQVVGRSKPKAKAVLLMDGSRNQADIRKESGMDQGNLSRLEKALRANGLLKPDAKRSQLVIAVPTNFFETSEEQDA